MSDFAACLIVLIALPAIVHAEAVDPCAYDKKAMLSLSENAFDQDLADGGGGWRGISKIPGCERAAADLLAAYRDAHPDSGIVLAWHEGQLLASAGDYARAIPLLESARKPPDKDSRSAAWNYYVDATIAFLRHDEGALLAAREGLAAIKYPSGADLPPLKDGFIEFPSQSGQPPLKMRWPPNIEVVDALVACFTKPYKEAYSASCHNRGT